MFKCSMRETSRNLSYGQICNIQNLIKLQGIYDSILRPAIQNKKFLKCKIKKISTMENNLIA